jgi:hypothetical protein
MLIAVSIDVNPVVQALSMAVLGPVTLYILAICAAGKSNPMFNVTFGLTRLAPLFKELKKQVDEAGVKLDGLSNKLTSVGGALKKELEALT